MLDEPGCAPRYWQQPALCYQSSDPYTWFSHPVATPARWAAWGQVDRALDSYLTGEMSPQPLGPPASYSQQQHIVKYSDKDQQMEAWDNDACEAAQKSALDAAHHARVAQGAATRLTLGNVGELVESVGALADTVRRMEERAVLLHERDEARIKVLELENSLAREEALRHKAEQSRNLEQVTIGAQTEQPVLESPPQLVAPAPPSQQMIVPLQREDERVRLDEELAEKLRAHERKVTALMEQSAALAEQQAKQALLLHERQTLMAERQLEAERRQLEAERRREEAERQRAEAEQLGMVGHLQAPPKEEHVTKMPSSPDHKTMEELATARAEIARLASTCEELRDRVDRAEAKQSTDSSGSEMSAISRGRRRHRRKRRSRRRQGDSLDDDDIENFDAEQFRILPVGRKAEPLSERGAAASAQRELDALRLQLRAREERDQARELAEATAARAKAEADLAEAMREIREHRNRAEDSALRLLEAERQRPEQLTSSSVTRLVEDKLALEAARLRDESNKELRRERDRLELDRLERERELANDAARRQRETENLLVKRLEELLSAVTATSRQHADSATQKTTEKEPLVRVAAENVAAVADGAKVEDAARIEGGTNDDIEPTGGEEDSEVGDTKDEPEAEPVLYKTLSSNDEIDNETTTATPRSMLRFDLPQRSSLDAIPGAEYASYGAYDKQEESVRPATPLNDEVPDVLMTMRWAKAARSQRAVTITFGDAPVPSEEAIRHMMSSFGVVSRCGRRQTTAVVLYVDPTSAARAARDYQGPWRVRRVADALSPGPTPRSRQSSAGSRGGRFFDNPQFSAPFSVVETSSRGFEMRTLDVVWGGRELAPKDDREFRAQFQFFGSIARSFRHDDRGMIMFSSPDECDRCLEEYRGPWRIARLATTIQRKPGKANLEEPDRAHMSGSEASPADAAVTARAIRCTFPAEAIATEDELLSTMNRFGTVVRARLGEASAVVMFAKAGEAERAIREYRGPWSVETVASSIAAAAPVTADTTHSAEIVRAASVKVAWNPGAPPPSERQLRLVLDEFGVIDRVVVRRRSAVVLYRNEAAAATAVRAYSGPWRLRRLFRLVKGNAAIKPGVANPAFRAAAPVDDELPTTRRRNPSSKRVQVAEVEDHPLVIEAGAPKDHDSEPGQGVDNDGAIDGEEEFVVEEGEKFPVEELEQHQSHVGEDDDQVPFASGEINDAEDEGDDVEDIQEPVEEEEEEDVEAMESQDRVRLERQERKRAATAELARMSTLSESLASRCIKVSWRIRPKTDAAFAAALADMGIVYVKASPLREKSAIFMFADSEQAARAVETINVSTDAFRAQVVDQPRRGSEPDAPPPTAERMALRERVRHELEESAAPAPGLPALAERCVKVAWAKSKGPASESDFEALMTALGLTFISKVIRTNSAILMFASPQLAHRAVDVINDRRGRNVTVANQKKVIEWTASIVASSSSSNAGSGGSVRLT